MGRKRWRALLAGVLAAAVLGGCGGSGPSVLVFKTPGNSVDDTFCPAAISTGDGILLRTLDRVEYNDEPDHPNNLYLWQGDTVCKYEPGRRLNGLIQLDGGYYHWQYDGVYRYLPETGASERLFPLEEGKTVGCFWGHDGMLYAVERPYLSDTAGYTLCRYDLRTGRLYREEWFPGADGGRNRLFFYAAAGDELLVQPMRGAGYWLDLTDGSRREWPVDGTVYGCRDGCLAFFQGGSENSPGWDAIRLRDIRTGAQSEIPLPAEILSGGERYRYELLAVGEEAVYWEKDHTLYRQTGDRLEAVFAWYGRDTGAAEPFYQLLDGVYCFAFLGRPAEGFEAVDLAPYDPEQDTGKVMQFAALAPDGTVYILAKEYYDAVWDLG